MSLAFPTEFISLYPVSGGTPAVSEATEFIRAYPVSGGTPDVSEVLRRSFSYVNDSGSSTRELNFVVGPTSSAKQVESPQLAYNLSETIQKLFSSARYQVFEDGVESEFSRGLIDIIRRNGAAALKAISDLLAQRKCNAEVGSEALRWIGLMGDDDYYIQRRQLLIANLSSPSARIRDAATLGLSFLGDPLTIEYLQNAIKIEKNAELKVDMIAVLEDLERLTT
jgi:hypothetical protein